jgi:RHS repeat-associated protein
VKKVSGSTTTVYIFSGSKVVAEYDNGALPASPSREYIYSGSSLLAKIAGSTTNYYHQDLLSNRLVTDSNGSTLAQLGHYPFGESWYNASSDKLLFTSYERDSESGNDYAMARFNVSRLGRFSSPDPLGGSIGDPQSLNRYPYVNNDPINGMDPLGLCDWSNPDPNDPSCSIVICYPDPTCGVGGSGGSGGVGGCDPIFNPNCGGGGPIGGPFGGCGLYIACLPPGGGGGGGGPAGGGGGGPVGGGWCPSYPFLAPNCCPDPTAPCTGGPPVGGGGGGAPVGGGGGGNPSPTPPPSSGGGNNNGVHGLAYYLFTTNPFPTAWESLKSESGCGHIIAETFLKDLSPVPVEARPSIGDAIPFAGKATAAAGLARASAYSVSRGLVQPLKSGTFRALRGSGILTSTVAEELIAPAVIVYAGGDALFKSISSAAQGECH